jgi:hypothetical protein
VPSRFHVCLGSFRAPPPPPPPRCTNCHYQWVKYLALATCGTGMHRLHPVLNGCLCVHVCSLLSLLYYYVYYYYSCVTSGTGKHRSHPLQKGRLSSLVRLVCVESGHIRHGYASSKPSAKRPCVYVCVYFFIFSSACGTGMHRSNPLLNGYVCMCVSLLLRLCVYVCVFITMFRPPLLLNDCVCVCVFVYYYTLTSLFLDYILLYIITYPVIHYYYHIHTCNKSLPPSACGRHWAHVYKKRSSLRRVNS